MKHMPSHNKHVYEAKSIMIYWYFSLHFLNEIKLFDETKLRLILKNHNIPNVVMDFRLQLSLLFWKITDWQSEICALNYSRHGIGFPNADPQTKLTNNSGICWHMLVKFPKHLYLGDVCVEHSKN